MNAAMILNDRYSPLVCLRDLPRSAINILQGEVA